MLEIHAAKSITISNYNFYSLFFVYLQFLLFCNVWKLIVIYCLFPQHNSFINYLGILYSVPQLYLNSIPRQIYPPTLVPSPSAAVIGSLDPHRWNPVVSALLYDAI